MHDYNHEDYKYVFVNPRQQQHFIKKLKKKIQTLKQGRKTQIGVNRK